MALQKMAEYSNEMLAPMRASITHPSPACMFGTANQIAAMQGTPSRTVAASHGFRFPPASAIAPRIGAPRATRKAADEVT